MEIKKQKTVSELREKLSLESEARAAISAIFDEGTFLETGAFVKRAPTEFTDAAEANLEGVITGYGAIDGRLVFAFVQDYSRMKGALGAAHANKICALYDMALKSGAPVIGIFNSAGASVAEGVGALAGYGRIMKSVATASGVIPQIALISGICAGSCAVIAEMFDLIIAAEDNAKLYVTPPFVLKADHKSSDIGSVKASAALGQISLVAADTAEAAAKVRSLINFLPQNNTEGTVYALATEDVNRLTPDISDIIAAAGYDMKELCSAISDNNLICELGEAFAPELVTCFIQLGGMVAGVCANQPKVNGGAVTPDAARKAARFVSFCDCFNIPLLTIVDTKGFDATLVNESAPYSSSLAKLASAYASATTPMVTLIAGAAYGSAFSIMGSKAVGTDIAFALDTANISIMAPEAAVSFIWDKKDGDSASLLAEWNKSVATPVIAAGAGEIDDIIACDEIRIRIASAFEMLSYKSDVKKAKKHTSLPL